MFINLFSPDEALMALAVMHNLAPEELKVKRARMQRTKLINLFISVQKLRWPVCFI